MKYQFKTDIDFHYPNSSWQGVFDSQALGCSTENEPDNSWLWFLPIWISIF